MTSPTNRKGNITTTAAVVARLLELGHEVFLPFGDGTDADCILAPATGGLIRTQIKTGRLVQRQARRVVIFNTFSVCAVTKVKTDYRGRADLFIAWCPETHGAWAIPVADVGGGTCTMPADEATPYRLESFDFAGFVAGSPDLRPSREPPAPAGIRRDTPPTKAGEVRSLVLATEGVFCLRDVRARLPHVGKHTIQAVLAEMRRAGETERVGSQGPGAGWRRIGA